MTETMTVAEYQAARKQGARTTRKPKATVTPNKAREQARPTNAALILAHGEPLVPGGICMSFRTLLGLPLDLAQEYR